MGILSNIQERVENTVIEHLRLELVAQGYIPDIQDYLPQSQANINAYKAEEAAIITTKGFSIGLFNHSSSDKKYSKSVPRIVLMPRKFNQGDVGNSPYPAFVENEDGLYDGYFQAPTSSDYWFDLMLATNSAAQDRILHSIIRAVFAKRKYIDLLYGTENPVPKVLIEHLDEAYAPDDVEGVINRLHSYRIIDLYETEAQLANLTVGKMAEIEVVHILTAPE